MANGRRCQRLLTEASNQHRIIADEVGQDHLDRVRCLEKNVTRLEDHAHSTLAQTPLQLIAGIEYGFALKRLSSRVPVLWTVVDFVGETAPTRWTFFHLVKRLESRRLWLHVELQTLKQTPNLT